MPHTPKPPAPRRPTRMGRRDNNLGYEGIVALVPGLLALLRLEKLHLPWVPGGCVAPPSPFSLLAPPVVARLPTPRASSAPRNREPARLSRPRTPPTSRPAYTHVRPSPLALPLLITARHPFRVPRPRAAAAPGATPWATPVPRPSPALSFVAPD